MQGTKYVGITKDKSQGNRKRLKVSFDDLFNLKLEKINCSLVCIRNFFKKQNSQRSSAPDWSGTYKCKICETIYVAKIDEIGVGDINLVLSLKSSESALPLHEKTKLPSACRGEIRDMVKNEIMSKGTLNTINNNIISNHEQENGKCCYLSESERGLVN